MSRRNKSPGGCGLSAVVWTALVLCAPVFGAPLTVTVLKRDGTPLPGAVVSAEAESPLLPPAAPVKGIMDQVDLTFVPDVLVIPVHSTVQFPNSDAISHQVYSFSNARSFQLPLYRGKPYPPVSFDQPGVVTLGCNIHDNMLSYIIVTAAPFFGRTDRQGEWTAADVPQGRYRLRIWHPLLNEPRDVERVIETGADRTPIQFRLAKALKPAPLNGRPHSWDY
ncbi:MAG: methylamine utilization protein [Pseudomonadota bacterium]